jgi:hypothetical protein
MTTRYKYTVAAALVWALQASVVQGQVNHVVDCSQYPEAEAQVFAEEYLPECRDPDLAVVVTLGRICETRREYAGHKKGHQGTTCEGVAGL